MSLSLYHHRWTGEAPINISNKINHNDARENEDKSSIENPAVRLETE